MHRQRLLLLVSIIVLNFAGLLFRALAPARFDLVYRKGQELVSDVPEAIVLGGVLLWVVVTWVAALIVLAMLTYWCWRQIDDYVLRLWDMILPESPIVRLAAGLTIMIFLFVFGPLLILQSTDLLGEDDSVEDQLETNQTETPANETTDEDSNETNQSSSLPKSLPNGKLIYTYSHNDIILPAKDPYLGM